MHELSVATAILESIERKLGGRMELGKIQLTLGPLSCINPDALRFCLQTMAESEGFGQPELDVREVEARIVCRDCGREYSASEFYVPCPHCGSLSKTILSGRECNVDFVELIGDQ